MTGYQGAMSEESMQGAVERRTVIRRAALDHLVAHVHATPAHESCGALLGRQRGAERTIERVHPVVNEAADVWRGYLIPAERVRRIERDARTDGLAIVGFYHSHPDGSGAPSSADARDAWPWYTYLIVPCGVAQATVTAWRLRPDRSAFDAEELACAE